MSSPAGLAGQGRAGRASARTIAVAALGERERIRCYAFAGVRLAPAEDAEAVRAAWRSLPADTGLVILTPAARAALGSALLERDERLWAAMPA